MARALCGFRTDHVQHYLMLDTLLECQRLESMKAHRPAHDEMLFIVTHQTYELWFKQILHELDAVLAIMGQPVVPERELGRVLRYLERIVVIQELLVEQIGILETMTRAGLSRLSRPAGAIIGFPERAVPPHRKQARTSAHATSRVQRDAL